MNSSLASKQSFAPRVGSELEAGNALAKEATKKYCQDHRMKLTDILAEATEVKHTANIPDPIRNWGFPIPPTLQPELRMQGRLGRPFNFSGSWGAPGIRPGKDHSDFRGHFRTKKTLEPAEIDEIWKHDFWQSGSIPLYWSLVSLPTVMMCLDTLPSERHQQVQVSPVVQVAS